MYQVLKSSRKKKKRWEQWILSQRNLKTEEQGLHLSKRNGHRTYTEESLGTQEGGGSDPWCGHQEILIRQLTITQDLSIQEEQRKTTLYCRTSWEAMEVRDYETCQRKPNSPMKMKSRGMNGGVEGKLEVFGTGTHGVLINELVLSHYASWSSTGQK